MRRQKGFSLIELLIVVAIILVLVAILVPNLLRSRIAANEASAVGSIHSIGVAEVSYSTAYPATGFSADLPSLGGANPCTPAAAHGCLLDDSLANATTAATPKSGYYFTYAAPGGAANSAYTIKGLASVQGATGQRSFFSDQSCVIRSDPGTAASATSTQI